jgi:hypothetical protein
MIFGVGLIIDIAAAYVETVHSIVSKDFHTVLGERVAAQFIPISYIQVINISIFIYRVPNITLPYHAFGIGIYIPGIQIVIGFKTVKVELIAYCTTRIKSRKGKKFIFGFINLNFAKLRRIRSGSGVIYVVTD